MTEMEMAPPFEEQALEGVPLMGQNFCIIVK